MPQAKPQANEGERQARYTSALRGKLEGYASSSSVGDDATQLAHAISGRKREVQPACLSVYYEAATSSCTPAGGFHGFPAGVTSAGLGHCCFPNCCFLPLPGRFAAVSSFLRARFFPAIFKQGGAKKTSGALQHASEFDPRETVNL